MHQIFSRPSTRQTNYIVCGSNKSTSNTHLHYLPAIPLLDLQQRVSPQFCCNNLASLLGLHLTPLLYHLYCFLEKLWGSLHHIHHPAVLLLEYYPAKWG